MNYHEIKIGNVTRKLPLVRVAPTVQIALFISLGDTEVCTESAKLLAEQLPPADILLTAETKGISIAHALSLELGMPKYIVARKTAKPYMNVTIKVDVNSISTQATQTLYLDANDAQALAGKKVIIIDDVISTGESLTALEDIVAQAGGEIVGKAAILAEGDAKDRQDITFLEYIPLFS